jgi:phage terminase large subunit-like protein
VEKENVYLPGAPNAAGSGYDRTLTPERVTQLVDECAAFPNAAYDDGVDALTQALAILSKPRPQFRSFG